VPNRVWSHRVPGITWPRSARAGLFALIAPKLIARHHCDVVMSFDRILGQDIFRSGEGPRRLLLEKLKRHSGVLRKIWYATSLYHHLLVYIEKLQVGANRNGKIIAVCNQTKRDFVECYGIPEERIVVIHNGVDAERFDPRRRLHEGKRLREALKIPADTPVVLFVGTGFLRKGLHRLLDLWERRDIPGAHLLIVGNDSKLAQYRRQWGGRSDVTFAGQQEKVEDYYACADLLVLPAIQEAFGNVVLEALSSGLPVVTVNGVGAMDLANGELSEGILSRPDDPLELKSKILQMLERDRWAAFSRAARQTAERYSWENYLDRTEQTLFECCRKTAAAPAESHAVMNVGPSGPLVLAVPGEFQSAADREAESRAS
jgi:UDP-glucose:(heptosyl)LPS alpha-1,3-glucosyltransferase